MKRVWGGVWEGESRPAGLGKTDYEEGVGGAIGRVNGGGIPLSPQGRGWGEGRERKTVETALGMGLGGRK
jgi:hypothetical protein